MNLNLKEKYYLYVPVLLALIFAIVVTVSNDFPLSWDIYTHINYALAYMHGGITNTDYLLNAPYGKSIGYPPLFHILLIAVSSLFGSDFVFGAKVLQILFVVLNVSVITYIASRFYDSRSAMFAGLLLLSSFMFTRFLLPIPESLAMIFFTMAVYSYYKSTYEDSYIYSILTAVLSLLTLVTHFSSFVYLMVLLFVLMFVQLVNLRSFAGLKHYVLTVVPIFLLAAVGLVGLFVISPSHLSGVLSGIVAIVHNPFDLFMGQVAMGLERYVRCVGILPLVFGGLALYIVAVRREFYFVTLWALVAFLFTNLHWFGVPVYTFRLLLYFIVPLVMLGGYALSAVYEVLSEQGVKYQRIFVLVLIILSVGLCTFHINDSSVTIFSASSEQSTFQISPPTSDEQELINFFKSEETENKSIIINNLYLGTVISSIDEIPVHYGFDVYTNKSLTKSSADSLNKEQIGYIIYDKKLIMQNNSDYDYLDVRYVNGSFYPSYYFTNEITQTNFNNIKLQFTTKIFENERFIVCKV